MAPSGSIVCGVDHSAGARAAARFAAAIADRLGSRLVLVHVVQPPIPQTELGMAARRTDRHVIEELQSAGADLLEEVAKELVSREVVAELKFGEASGSIAGVAEETRAEFLVVGSRGLGSMSALLLGSTSLWLAGHAPCPTVVVPESGGTTTDAPLLCAVDDSEESRAAVATAAKLAERLDVELVLVHAEPDGARVSAAEELLARLVAERGLGTSPARIVAEREPAEGIVETAAARGVEMIVIGSRGRGALASAALGSVSSAVATRAPCPVMIVRADTGSSVDG